MESMKVKRTILALISIIAVFYCFDFGFLLTAYAHGGQILGIPFAIWILISTIRYYFDGSIRHFAMALTSFLSFFLLALVILIIKEVRGDWFEFLYVYGNVEDILLFWLLATVVFTWGMNRHFKRKQTSSMTKCG